MAEKVTVTRTKANPNIFKVQMEITQGKVISLINALEQYADQSPVAQDLLAMLKTQATDAGIDV